MLADEIRSQMLVDELQLGERLNNDLQSCDRADFALLLSMLSQDITDHAEFCPEQEQKAKEPDLRRRFNLPPKQENYAKAEDFSRAALISDTFVAEGLGGVFFAHCFKREPFVPFEHRLNPEVFAELTPLKQEKLRLEAREKVLEYQKIHESGEGFEVLSELTQSRNQILPDADNDKVATAKR
ncbi:MAG: hypothetical protein J6M93_01115 [Succinivibrio sp.]|nr:hypothetical protein [Succinivibrio sp.]